MAATTAQNTSQHGQSQHSDKSSHKSAKPPSQLEQLPEPIDQDPANVAMHDAAEQEPRAQTEQLQDRSEVPNGHILSVN